jgi:hypothetical protein
MLNKILIFSFLLFFSFFFSVFAGEVLNSGKNNQVFLENLPGLEKVSSALSSDLDKNAGQALRYYVD